MDRIAEETEHRIAQTYAALRQMAADRVTGRVQAVHAAHPELAELDRALSQAGSELLLRSLAPDPAEADAARHRLRTLQEQRQALVRRLELDPAYDRPNPTCSLCGDTGKTKEGVVCACRERLRTRFLKEASELGPLTACTFAVHDDSLFEDAIHAERDKADVSPRVQIQGIRAACRTFAREAAASGGEARDLLLVGNPGTGKTFMAACIANDVITRGRSVLYLPAPVMFARLTNHRTLSASFRPDEDRLEEAEREREAILETRLLVIDDLGTETIQPHTLPEFLQVLDHRHGAGLRTVFSTNVDLQTLRQHYDERLWSRLIGHCTVLRFIGDDLRLRAARIRRQSGARSGAPNRES